MFQFDSKNLLIFVSQKGFDLFEISDQRLKHFKTDSVRKMKVLRYIQNF